MRKNVWIALGCAFLALSGCGKAKPRAAKVLRIGLAIEPSTVDPRRTGDPSSCLLSFMLFEGLTHQEADGSIRLAAAESVQISEDRLQYRFTLRPAKWTNGTQVRAKDFEYAWKSALSPHYPCPSAYLFYPIKNARACKMGLCPVEDVGVSAVTDRELLITLEKPTPYFLELVSFCSFFPVCEREEMQNPDWMNQVHHSIPTNGPFRLQNWQHHRSITVEKNPHHWDAERIPLGAVDISIIENQNTGLQLFEKKKLDWIGGAFISSDVLAVYDDKPECTKHGLAGTAFITFNTTRTPFNNQSIRKAFSYAIDRGSIVRNISHSRSAGCLIPPSLRQDNLTTNYFKGHAAKQALHFFEDGCRELGLSEETFPPIVYYYFNNETEKRVALALQNQWHNVLGVDVELRCLDFKVFVDKMYKKDYSVAQIAAIAQYFDAMNILERFQFAGEKKNYSKWENRDYQALLEAARYEIDDKRRGALYNQAEKILMDDFPICPLYFMEEACFQNSNVQGVEVTPIGVIHFRHADVKAKESAL